jgi:hypothetical protein
MSAETETWVDEFGYAYPCPANEANARKRTRYLLSTLTCNECRHEHEYTCKHLIEHRSYTDCGAYNDDTFWPADSSPACMAFQPKESK